jgi:hypothetical protein
VPLINEILEIEREPMMSAIAHGRLENNRLIPCDSDIPYF